jgi:nanoRNase/pAp phosphatase (c-di-AMP/oligoRNAs hydrolase)
MDAAAKQQIADKVKQAEHILVTVSSNPSVDQLAAAIGLTLMLNKMGKTATAVFSGKVPSTLEFLQPQKTIQTNTDSLRDFIISLDKAKADKLRYKVEDQVVRIFITPYKTRLSEKDLVFEEGDFKL